MILNINFKLKNIFVSQYNSQFANVIKYLNRKCVFLLLFLNINVYLIS